MDRLSRPDEALVPFPLWSLIRLDKKGDHIVTVPGPNGEKAAPLFTHRDLVDRFRTSDPGLRRTFRAVVKDAAKLLVALALLGEEGFTHVIIDPDRKGTRLLPLAQVRAFTAPKPPAVG